MSTQAIDFSSVGGNPVAPTQPPPAGALDFSSLGGKPVAAAPAQPDLAAGATAIGPSPQPAGLADRIATWARNVQNDVKYGTDLTGIGTVLQKLGAHGVYSGEPQAVGDFMASLPLGLAQATQGGAQLAVPGQRLQGAGNVVGGALQAVQIPASFAAGPVEEEAAGAAGKAASAAGNLMPSAERAGAAFERVKQAAGSVTVDTAQPGNVALRTYELAKSGGSMPKVMRDFLNRVSDPDRGPLTWSEARDFYSNASRLSADEYNRLTPTMKRQAAMFTQSLGQSINAGAAQVGKLEEFLNAMQEYKHAKQLEDFGENVVAAAKRALPYAAATAAGGAAGAWAVRSLYDLFGK